MSAQQHVIWGAVALAIVIALLASWPVQAPAPERVPIAVLKDLPEAAPPVAPRNPRSIATTVILPMPPQPPPPAAPPAPEPQPAPPEPAVVKPHADAVCGARGRTWYVKDNGWRYWRCNR
jgi:hypothetical protein